MSRTTSEPVQDVSLASRAADAEPPEPPSGVGEPQLASHLPATTWLGSPTSVQDSSDCPTSLDTEAGSVRESKVLTRGDNLQR